MSELKCPECKGNVKVERVENYNYRVCQDCGEVVDEKDMVFEEQSAIEHFGDYEVME